MSLHIVLMATIIWLSSPKDGPSIACWYVGLWASDALTI
jgi:hypothetical protein